MMTGTRKTNPGGSTMQQFSKTDANEDREGEATVSRPAAGSPGAIVDNQGDNTIAAFLKDRIESGAGLSFVSAYFTIYAYGELRSQLENADRFRFLYGDPFGAETPVDINDVKAFRLNDNNDIEIEQVIKQKPLASACQQWIQKDAVQIRTIKKDFLHGKLYHIVNSTFEAALMGSSNFTKGGLGIGRSPNIELNMEIRDEGERDELLRWFDKLWEDDEKTEDAKERVLAALGRISASYPPEFVYYKTLLNIFAERLEQYGESDTQLGEIQLKATAIWNKLYEFQQQGVVSAISQLHKYNGCIIADSVGLGKTLTALAVIKYFELRNERVLVLCPKKLKHNWTQYVSLYGHTNNIFAEDRLNYTVLAHTDLNRETGNADGIDLSKFNWSAYDLVVIDESHNFRNEGRKEVNEKGEVVKRSRYYRLLEDVIQEGVKTKVLMLSATPVNTSLRDLRNQIYLMTEKQQEGFFTEFGIRNLEDTFGRAERAFKAWEKQREAGENTSKAKLIEGLGPDILTLLDAVSIARSRSHISEFYKSDIEKMGGGFPDRRPTDDRHPATDKENALSYSDMANRILNMRLAVYQPSRYRWQKEKKKRGEFSQVDRENALVKMMHINYLKRLESSVHSYTETLGRLLKHIDSIDKKIEGWKKQPRDAGTLDIEVEGDEDDNDDFLVGKKVKVHLAEIDIDHWQNHIREDRAIVEGLYAQSKEVVPDRDAKLHELKRILREKVQSPSEDRDGKRNRKVLVFTTFADTAEYLYGELGGSMDTELGAKVELVTGETKQGKYLDILERFSPRSKEVYPLDPPDSEIDVLIATDCLSEGQNLQDCDLVVNYDIHWNPVRLLQRFGRIDRLGSRNKTVGMINLWPMEALNEYLNLVKRVENRMALVVAMATGDDNHLEKDDTGSEDGQFHLRKNQISRMINEGVDLFDLEDEGIGLDAFSLENFVDDLRAYLGKYEDALRAAPNGIYAIAKSDDSEHGKLCDPGTIFCLEYIGDSERVASRVWPYFLIHVTMEGEVRIGFEHPHLCLKLFQELAQGKDKPLKELEDAFDQKTSQGTEMEEYSKMLRDGLAHIIAGVRRDSIKALFGKGGKLSIVDEGEESDPRDKFRLVTWLVIA